MKAAVSQCVVAPQGETLSKYFHCETPAGFNRQQMYSLCLYSGEKTHGCVCLGRLSLTQIYKLRLCLFWLKSCLSACCQLILFMSERVWWLTESVYNLITFSQAKSLDLHLLIENSSCFFSSSVVGRSSYNLSWRIRSENGASEGSASGLEQSCWSIFAGGSYFLKPPPGNTSRLRATHKHTTSVHCSFHSSLLPLTLHLAPNIYSSMFPPGTHLQTLDVPFIAQILHNNVIFLQYKWDMSQVCVYCVLRDI